MIDLKTSYMGLPLSSPLVASASPLCERVDNIRRMEDAGLAAVVLHSLFEEQVTQHSYQLDLALSYGAESHHEAVTYFPDMTSYNLGPDGYLEHIRKAKQAVSIPIIASINGVTTGAWIEYARLIEEAGADALELNMYYVPAATDLSGAEVEQMYIDLVTSVKRSIHIPLAVKLSHYFSSPAHMAKRLDEAGADALVLFNRFYQPDFDLEYLDVLPNLVLSNPMELRVRLRWVAILYGRIQASLAVTGGVHDGLGMLKSMMAGASVAMMTSALLRNGISYAAEVKAEVIRWMVDHEYVSIRQMQGSMSQRSIADPAAFERANYMQVLKSFHLPPGLAR